MGKDKWRKSKRDRKKARQLEDLYGKSNIQIEVPEIEHMEIGENYQQTI